MTIVLLCVSRICFLSFKTYINSRYKLYFILLQPSHVSPVSIVESHPVELCLWIYGSSSVGTYLNTILTRFVSLVNHITGTSSLLETHKLFLSPSDTLTSGEPHYLSPYLAPTSPSYWSLLSDHENPTTTKRFQ